MPLSLSAAPDSRRKKVAFLTLLLEHMFGIIVLEEFCAHNGSLICMEKLVLGISYGGPQTLFTIRGRG
jgi:hypothetical protein